MIGRAYFRHEAIREIADGYYSSLDREMMVGYNVMHGISENRDAYPLVWIWVPRDEMAKLLFPDEPEPDALVVPE